MPAHPENKHYSGRGYLTAPDGEFDVPYIGINLVYVMESFARDQKGKPLRETDLINTTNWRFRASHQWYFASQRKNGSTRDMELLGAKIDWMGGDWCYLKGQALSACDGGAGGYSEGHWGAGVYSQSWNGWQVYAEMLLGAGKNISNTGNLDVTFIDVDFVWRFGSAR